MKGTRPLNNDEIRRVSAAFTGTYEVRNRGLFMLGVSTGARISELLSLQIGDVFQNRKPVGDLLFKKSIVKGGEVSRSCSCECGRQESHLRTGELAPPALPLYRFHPSVVPFTPPIRHSADAPSNSTRHINCGKENEHGMVIKNL